MILLEPRWKSYIVATNEPIFTPEQCDHIIRIGQSMPQQDAKVGTGPTVNNLPPTFLFLMMISLRSPFSIYRDRGVMEKPVQ